MAPSLVDLANCAVELFFVQQLPQDTDKLALAPAEKRSAPRYESWEAMADAILEVVWSPASWVSRASFAQADLIVTVLTETVSRDELKRLIKLVLKGRSKNQAPRGTLSTCREAMALALRAYLSALEAERQPEDPPEPFYLVREIPTLPPVERPVPGFRPMYPSLPRRPVVPRRRHERPASIPPPASAGHRREPEPPPAAPPHSAPGYPSAYDEGPPPAPPPHRPTEPVTLLVTREDGPPPPPPGEAAGGEAAGPGLEAPSRWRSEELFRGTPETASSVGPLPERPPDEPRAPPPPVVHRRGLRADRTLGAGSTGGRPRGTVRLAVANAVDADFGGWPEAAPAPARPPRGRLDAAFRARAVQALRGGPEPPPGSGGPAGPGGEPPQAPGNVEALFLSAASASSRFVPLNSSLAIALAALAGAAPLPAAVSPSAPRGTLPIPAPAHPNSPRAGQQRARKEPRRAPAAPAAPAAAAHFDLPAIATRQAAPRAPVRIRIF